jgi:2-hydroxy-3-oxopropionate reductase
VTIHPREGSTASVSVIGLGRMGRPIARSLHVQGFLVRGWNRSPRRPEEVGGIELCETLSDAAKSETIMLVLADSDAVDGVLAELEGQLTGGQIVIDLGSSEPERSRAHAARLSAAGIGWIDAPVSGGPEGAQERRLAIMAGGEAHDLARVEPLLEALGTVVHVGGPGAGHTVKIVNQVIVGLMLEAIAEALALAEKAGLDPRLVQAALRGGSADSRLLQVQGARMIERDFAARGAVRTMLKDGRLGLSLAESVGAELPHLRSLVDAWEELVLSGHADDDCTRLITRLLNGDRGPR